MKELIAQLSHTDGITLRSDVDGRAVTTIAVGGPLTSLIEVESVQGLKSALKILASDRSTYRTLGAGSNLLLPDSGIDAPIFRLGRGFRYVNELFDNHYLVGAAHALMTLSRQMSEQGLSGLEFAGGIPATLGGAVFMNAGAHGGEMAQIVSKVRCLVPSGELLELRPSDLNFSYRRCVLPEGAVVIEVELKLVPGDKDKISQARAYHLAERKKRQPLHLPSAGSVFKNISAQLSAGKLIEQAGLKGKIIGNAQISELHANWIVNPERLAKASEVEQLITLCQSEVRRTSGHELEVELQRWSEC